MKPTTVPVTMPAWAWGRLATIADHRGVKVAELIADGIGHVLNTDHDRLAQLRNELMELNKTKRARG